MESVKREYRSTLRADQAARTRRTVVTAAAEMFVERGFAGTTIDAVATRAGVSRKTVFSAAGGKIDLLALAVDRAVAGDDESIPLADRDDVRAALNHDDPAELLAGWARRLVGIDERVGPLFRALEVAAESDDSALELLTQYQRRRLAGARAVVDRLTALNALRAAVKRTDAIDIAWLAADPVLYDRFVVVRGWSTRRFRGWLTDLLCTQLLTTSSDSDDVPSR